jgi:hypothetical protein
MKTLAPDPPKCSSPVVWTNKVICYLFSAAFAITLTSCVGPSRTVYKPKGEGYGSIDVTWRGVAGDITGYTELYYWDSRGKRTLVWPSLARLVPLGRNAAVFRGYLVDGPSDPYPGKQGAIYLFGVEGSEPVVQIREDIVNQWLGPSQKNLAKVLHTTDVTDIKRLDGKVRFRVRTGASEGTDLDLSDEEVLAIIRKVRERGKVVTDPGTGTPYLKLDRAAELREGER